MHIPYHGSVSSTRVLRVRNWCRSGAHSNTRDVASWVVKPARSCTTTSHCSETQKPGRIGPNGHHLRWFYSTGSRCSGRCKALPVDLIPSHFLATCGSTLTSTLAASVKLAFLCWLVATLRKIGKLPKNTAPVLSQVTFNLAIPCLLFTRLTQTVTLDDPTLLAVPVMAFLQVAVGAVLAKVAMTVVEGDYSTALAPFGWHPKHPSAASAAIAQTTAKAMGNPAAAAALLPKHRKVSPGLAGLITLMCSFGNSFSLPLVFLLTLLPAAQASPATAYTALFLMAWSPLFWFSCSYVLNRKATEEKQTEVTAPSLSLATAAGLPGPSITLVDSSYTRSYSLPLPGQQEVPSSSATWSDQLQQAWGGLQEWLYKQWKVLEPFLNPPTLATIVALLLILIPGFTSFIQQTPTQAMNSLMSQGVPLEVVALLGALRACYDMLDVLGSSTLALSGIVLAASLLVTEPAKPSQAVPSSSAKAGQSSGLSPSTSSASSQDRDLGSATIQRESGPAVERPIEVVDSGPSGPPSTSDSPLSNTPMHRSQRFQLPLLHMLVPADRVQRQAMLAIGVVRLIIMPLVGLGLWRAGEALGVVPLNPVCILAVLLQSMMPPAQNLVVYLQLNESTQELAPMAAQMLVRLYIISILPITFWVTTCLSLYPVAV